MTDGIMTEDWFIPRIHCGARRSSRITSRYSCSRSCSSWSINLSVTSDFRFLCVQVSNSLIPLALLFSRFHRIHSGVHALSSDLVHSDCMSFGLPETFFLFRGVGVSSTVSNAISSSLSVSEHSSISNALNLFTNEGGIVCSRGDASSTLDLFKNPVYTILGVRPVPPPIDRQTRTGISLPGILDNYG